MQYTYTHKHIYTCIQYQCHTYTHTHIHIFHIHQHYTLHTTHYTLHTIHTYIHTYIHTSCIHTYIHTAYIHTYTYISSRIFRTNQDTRFSRIIEMHIMDVFSNMIVYTDIQTYSFSMQDIHGHLLDIIPLCLYSARGFTNLLIPSLSLPHSVILSF